MDLDEIELFKNSERKLNCKYLIIFYQICNIHIINKLFDFLK